MEKRHSKSAKEAQRSYCGPVLVGLLAGVLLALLLEPHVCPYRHSHQKCAAYHGHYHRHPHHYGRKSAMPLNRDTEAYRQEDLDASRLGANYDQKSSGGNRPHAKQTWTKLKTLLERALDDGDVMSSPCACTHENTYDTVVVGGGISGLYTAWRLKSNSPGEKIAVLEATSRFGGRVFSVKLPGLPDVPADFGAMHYLEDNVSVQSYLIKHVLKMQSKDFPTNSSDPRLPVVLRGKRLTMQQLSNVTEISKVYDLTDAEKSFYTGPGSLYEYYVHRLVPNYDNATIDPWRERTSDGRFVKDLGWLELAVLANMSDEAMRLIIDSSGYADFWDNPNAAALAVQHTTFLHASEYKTFPGGMSDIVTSLVSVLKSLGVGLMANAKVSSLVKCAALYQLTAAKRTACGKKVILALPHKALSSFEWEGLQLSHAWQSVTPVHAMKLYLAYEKPWWREPPTQSKSGWLYTNLPIQQVLYLGSQMDHASTGTSAGNTNSLLMAMYCTEQYTTTWESLSRYNASLEIFKGRPNPFATDTTPPVVEEVGRPVTMEMLAVVRKQLAALHGLPLEAVPEPYTAALVDWPAAWHWWKPGANATELSEKVSQLSPSDDVYIVGEAYSNLQGWIQGALSNAEHVLQEKLGLPPVQGAKANLEQKHHNLWHHLRFGRFKT